MKKVLLITLAIFAMANSYAHERHIETDKNILKIYSEEDFTPFNFYDDLFKFKGASVEIVNEILKDAKFKHTNIKVIPWARAYHLAQTQPNSLLFSMYKTPLRENLFKWVGPIAKSKLIILIKKGHEINPETFTIASVRSSASIQTAQQKGISDDRFLKLNETDLGLRLLDMERVDAWAISEINARKVIKQHGLNFEDFYIYDVMAERDIYLGFNKDTPDSTINFFSQKLEELKKSGFVHHVLHKYNIE